MSKAQRPTSTWLTLLWLLLACACSRKDEGLASGSAGGGAPAASVRLAFVTNNASPFWRVAEAGLRKYEKDAGIQVDMKMPHNGTVEDQNQILQSLSSQGYQAIAVSVISPKDQLGLLNDIARKTSLITVDSDAAESKRLLYIGTDNFEAGKVLGERITRLLPHGGKIAVFVGSLSATNAAQRLSGVVAATSGHQIEIVAKREDNTDRKKARANVEAVIAAQRDLSLVVGLWNYNGPAIAAALEGLGKQGQIAAAVFDGDDMTLEAIERGTIQATVVQKPFQFGYLSAKWLHGLATDTERTKKSIPPTVAIDTGVTVIDKSNVTSFETELRDLRKSVQ
jgi:ribose transport system substrate-binding protein